MNNHVPQILTSVHPPVLPVSALRSVSINPVASSVLVLKATDWDRTVHTAGVRRLDKHPVMCQNPHEISPTQHRLWHILVCFRRSCICTHCLFFNHPENVTNSLAKSRLMCRHFKHLPDLLCDFFYFLSLMNLFKHGLNFYFESSLGASN